MSGPVGEVEESSPRTSVNDRGGSFTEAGRIGCCFTVQGGEERGNGRGQPCSSQVGEGQVAERTLATMATVTEGSRARADEDGRGRLRERMEERGRGWGGIGTGGL